MLFSPTIRVDVPQGPVLWPRERSLHDICSATLQFYVVEMASLAACWIASLGKEVPRKLQVFLCISAIVQSDQGKLDLRMARISMNLSGIRAEHFAKQVRISLHGSEHLVVLEKRIVSQSGLN
jgi:hypothetical protein